MRVRITTATKGTIDGNDLARFEVGRVYDMGTSLANYLMASGYAVPAIDDTPALITPPHELPRQSSNGVKRPTSEAADRRPAATGDNNSRR